MICTLGDLLLDVVVRGPAPLAVGADTTVETRLASGGQAANVAAWAVELGEDARFVGKVADDAAGELARSLLERRGVEVLGPTVEGRNGVVVALVGPDGSEEHAAAGVDVVDTTGAGDALSAGFIVGGIELGLEAAARCVGQLGAVPS